MSDNSIVEQLQDTIKQLEYENELLKYGCTKPHAFFINIIWLVPQYTYLKIILQSICDKKIDVIYEKRGKIKWVELSKE